MRRPARVRSPARPAGWRGRLLGAAAAALLATVASLASAPASACVLVFGQGRNFDPQLPDRNQYWDEVNGRFNLAAREPLSAAGLQVMNLVFPVAATDVPDNLRRLMNEVKRLGCTQVMETALFADTTTGVVIARVRLYPVMGLAGPRPSGTLPQIGKVAYVTQQEFPLEARVEDRMDPVRLGRVMGAEMLQALLPAATHASGPEPAPAAASGATATAR